jgi:hypothetical protein
MQVCDENHIDLYDGLILRVSADPHLKSVTVADQTAMSARTGVRHRNPMRSRAVRLHPPWAVADLKRATCYASLPARPVFASLHRLHPHAVSAGAREGLSRS